MPVQDSFPNLPGLVSQINDGGLTLPQPTLNVSQSTLLLGLATDGPQNTPVAISSISMGESIFGVVAKPTTVAGVTLMQKSIAARMYELFAAGCTDIRLCRVGGSFATLTLADSVAGNSLILTGNYPGIKYNASDNISIAASLAIGYLSPKVFQRLSALDPKTVGARIGVGWAIKRDIYVYPYLTLLPTQLEEESTSFNISTVFSVM